MQRIAFLLLLSLMGVSLSTPSQADSPACATDATLLQATTSTSAKIKGNTPDERLALHAYHPQYDSKRVPSPSDAYLVVGDAVEVIATCGNYAYVRYQGNKLVSTGWVEKGRLQAEGAAHARPSDTVTQVCEAAANVVNRNGADPFFLVRLPLASAPEGMEDRISKSLEDDVGPISRLDGMSRIKTGGQVVRVFPIEDGGTCPSNYLHVWPDDLSRPIAHTDKEQQFGDGQELVQVLGHPLVLNINYGNKTGFALGSLDKNGQEKSFVRRSGDIRQSHTTGQVAITMYAKQ
jgi:hypothetical protein